MDKHTLLDGARPQVFMGDLLGEFSTDERGERPRWTELRLYRLATDDQVMVMRDHGRDPGPASGPYLVHSLGRSVIFHKIQGGCGRGTPSVAGGLPGEMESCQECWPGEDAFVPPADSMVNAELDRGMAMMCETAPDVGNALREMTRRMRPGNARGWSSRRMSGPATGLLVASAPRDPAIAALLVEPEEVTPLA